MHRVVLAFVVLGWPWLAEAASFLDGNELLTACRQSRAYCGGYAAAIVDADEIMQEVCSVSALPIPAKVTTGQLADLVKKYLAEHPAERHLGAALLVRRAIVAAWGPK